MQAHNFSAPAPPPMNQPPAATGSGSTGGAGTAPAQPKQQRVRARRGQATDPHSIAERVRRTIRSSNNIFIFIYFWNFLVS